MRWREPSGRRDRGKGSTDDGGTGYLPTFPNLDDGLRIRAKCARERLHARVGDPVRHDAR